MVRRALAVFMILSLANVARAKTFHEEIPLKREKRAEIEIEIGTFQFELKKAEGNTLFSMEIEYDPDETAHELEHEELEGTGKIRLQTTRKEEGIELEDLRLKNNCKIFLTNRIPLDLSISSGAGKGDIDLTGLEIENLDLEMGVGRTNLVIGEKNPIVAKAINVKAGAVQFRAQKLCNADFREFHFEGRVGMYTLDFTGQLHGRARVEIELGLGTLTIVVPRGIGTKLKVTGSFVKSISGLEKKEGWYISPSFGKTEAELIVHVDGGLGTVNVESVD